MSLPIDIPHVNWSFHAGFARIYVATAWKDSFRPYMQEYSEFVTTFIR